MITARVYTNVLEAADCGGETNSPVLATGYKWSFSFVDFTEIVSSYGRFSWKSVSVIDTLGTSQVS